MSVPGVQHKSNLRIAKESTPGTAPGSATSLLEVESFDIDPGINTIQDPNPNTSGASSRDIVQNSRALTGSFRMGFGYDGCTELARWLLPTYSQSTVDTSARAHLFKEGNQLNYYTLEPSFGDLPSGKVTRIVGALCAGFDLDFASGIAMLDARYAGWGPPIPNQTPMGGSPTVGNKIRISHHGHLLLTSGNLKDGSGLAESAIFVRRLKLSVNYPLDTARNYGGSLWNDLPVRSGPMTARIECQCQWDATNYTLMTTLMTDAIPTNGLKFVWQHPTVIGATTAKRYLEIVASSPKPGLYKKAVPAGGVILQDYAWDLQFNDTDASCLKFTLQNAEAALA